MAEKKAGSLLQKLHSYAHRSPPIPSGIWNANWDGIERSIFGHPREAEKHAEWAGKPYPYTPKYITRQHKQRIT